MTDVVDSKTRSRIMAGIRGKNTKPELIVRNHLHRAGLRFRLHGGDLPGRPDLVFPRYRTVVFVHGCFWHRHKSCRFSYTPSNNREFWLSKFDANVERDKRKTRALRKLGWRVLVVWGCTLTERKLNHLASRIKHGI